jgi:hypothetical protein
LLPLALVAIVHAADRMPRVRADARAPETDHAVGFYDPQVRRVMLIGGAGDPTPRDRDAVWSWSGAGWILVTKAGPIGRTNAGAAYATARGKGIVAGGARKTADGTAWTSVGDSWEGDKGGWRQAADMPPRDHHALVEDGRGGVLMFGGVPGDRSAPWPTDTWRLDDGRWRRVATDGPAPRARTAMAYDARRGEVVLFGGVGAPSHADQSQPFFADTWIWNGRAWRKAAVAGPPGRYAHAMAFDERAGAVLLYSGAAAHKDAPLTDMWQWNGERWTKIDLSGPTPGFRYQPVMVYDRARARTVLYGGIGGPGDTWEWDGERWRQGAPGP